MSHSYKHPRAWTEAEDLRLAQLWTSNASHDDIVRAIAPRTYTAAKTRAYELGLHRPDIKRRINTAGRAHLGIASLEDIRQRCRINAESGCWSWSLSTVEQQGSTPVVTISKFASGPILSSMAGKRVTGRRVVALLTGKRMHPGWVAFCNCDDTLCLNPDHIGTGPRAKSVRTAVRRGCYDTIDKRQAMQRIGRLRRAFTPQQALEIWRSEEPTTVVARRFGVSKGTVARLRRGQTYRDALVMAGGLDVAAILSASKASPAGRQEGKRA